MAMEEIAGSNSGAIPTAKANANKAESITSLPLSTLTSRMKTERNNEGNRRARDAARLIATMTIHYTTTRIGIGYNDNATIL